MNLVAQKLMGWKKVLYEEGSCDFLSTCHPFSHAHQNKPTHESELKPRIPATLQGRGKNMISPMSLNIFRHICKNFIHMSLFRSWRLLSVSLSCNKQRTFRLLPRILSPIGGETYYVNTPLEKDLISLLCSLKQSSMIMITIINMLSLFSVPSTVFSTLKVTVHVIL